MATSLPSVSRSSNPFPPLSPNGSRSFPRKNLSRGHGEWNHYYVRGINGEIRLWVNGEEVSGGANSRPATGYLCLEAEGAPIEFRNLRIRELPLVDILKSPGQKSLERFRSTKVDR
jgi:hypothetical protein